MIGRGELRPLFAAMAVVVTILGSGVAWAQAPQVTVTPERQAVSVGQQFWVTVAVQSESGGAQVSLPAGSPFQIVRHGGTSTSIQFRSGFGFGNQMTRSESIRYVVVANQAGRHTLGPMVISLGGRQYRAGSAVIQVNAAGAGVQPPAQPQPQPQPFPFPQPMAQPQPQPQAQPQQPGSSIPSQISMEELTGAVFDPELFLRTVLEPDEVYVGQRTVMTVYLYTTLNMSNINVTREPSTDGFWSEDLREATRRITFEPQLVGATQFRVAVLRKVALYPLRAGELTVGAPQLTASTLFRSIFSNRGGSVSRTGSQVRVRARALPTKGRPDGFNQGNVGRFAIRSSVDRQTTKVGDPLTLTVTVSGEGNLRNLKLAPLGDLQGARVYDSKARDTIAARVNSKGQTVSERSWEYLILPQEERALELPSTTMDYFDPVAGEYRTGETKAITVQVTGGTGGGAAPIPTAPDGSSPTPEATSEELGPLRSIQREASLSANAAPLHERIWFLVLVLLAPAVFVTVVVVQRVRKKRLSSAGAVRSRKAGAVARRTLSAVSSGTSEEDGTAAIMRALHTFFADRYGEPVSGMTKEELQAFLSGQGVSGETASEVAAVLEGCEQLRYAPGAEGQSAVAALAERASDLVAGIDRSNGNGGAS